MTTQINGAEHRVTHGKGHNPLAIANCFVEKANANGKPLSILQLIKLVYLAHGWCLGYTTKPLINADVEAWRHGPVIREVYDEFRPQGIHNIVTTASTEDGEVYTAKLTPKQKEILDEVYQAYSPLTAFEISNLTHARGTPWAQTEGYYAPIDDDIIRKYYEKRVQAHERGGHD